MGKRDKRTRKAPRNFRRFGEADQLRIEQRRRQRRANDTRRQRPLAPAKRKPRNTATQPGQEGITAVSTDMRAGGFAADTETKRGFR